jgi:hypothetical protein
VITFHNDKCFGLADIGQRGPEGNTPVGRKGEVSSAIIPTTHGISFCDLSISTSDSMIFGKVDLMLFLEVGTEF